MDFIAHSRRLLAYDDWGNRETVVALRQAASPSARAARIMAHVVGAEWLWLGRLRQNVVPAAVWPEITLEQSEAQLPRLRAAWHEYLDSIGPDDLQRSVSYTNSQGERWTSTVQDILTHVVIHSAYHRGQVAMDARDSGATPAYTDFIHCVRNGFLD
jgi:uncharacterized damage-inducible protein DinB